MDNKYEHNRDHEHSHVINEKRTRVVIYLTAVTMIAEIIVGYFTNSMALLADGFHMASHVFALGLTWVAYYVMRKNIDNHKFKSGTKKILSLSGYTSAVILLVVAVIMAIESVNRLFHPLPIHFRDAIIVGIIGLIVNLISAKILHTEDHHHDHNIRSAYLHVLADALTSVTAIIALVIGFYWNIFSLDAISGIISSIVITKWAIDLMKDSGKELLDYFKHEVLN